VYKRESNIKRERKMKKIRREETRGRKTVRNVPHWVTGKVPSCPQCPLPSGKVLRGPVVWGNCAQRAGATVLVRSSAQRASFLIIFHASHCSVQHHVAPSRCRPSTPTRRCRALIQCPFNVPIACNLVLRTTYYDDEEDERSSTQTTPINQTLPESKVTGRAVHA
jgi:hypothetical protein